MSIGLTPYEFVQKVFYVQEKVILDFVPTDDVFKEVLMEANLMLEELQAQEDWLWLRDTIVAGVSHASHVRQEIQLPPDFYKPSNLYGDCVRLHRYRFTRDMHRIYRDWRKVVAKYGRVLPSSVIDCTSKVILPDQTEQFDLDGYRYGGTFTGKVDDVWLFEIDQIEPGLWYLDGNGDMLIGVKSETGCCGKIYRCILDDQDVPDEVELNKFVPCKQRAVYLPGNPIISIIIDEDHFIKVPYATAGQQYRTQISEYGRVLQTDKPDRTLKAVIVGDKIKFTRSLHHYEDDLIVMLDCQRKIKPFHICDDECVGETHITKDEFGAWGIKSAPVSYPDNPCYFTTMRYLTELPDPNYVVVKTAALHAEGSPVAQGRLAGLQDQASKLLSSMRSNNAEHTFPDVIDYDPIGYINVV